MRVLRRLFGSLVPYLTTLAVSVVLLLVRAGVELLPPLFQRRIIDGVIDSRDLSQLGGAVAACTASSTGANSSLGRSRFDTRLVRHYNASRFVRYSPASWLGTA